MFCSVAFYIATRQTATRGLESESQLRVWEQRSQLSYERVQVQDRPRLPFSLISMILSLFSLRDSKAGRTRKCARWLTATRKHLARVTRGLWQFCTSW